MQKVSAYTDRVTESGEWRSGNPATGQSATPMLAAYFNMLQRELVNVVTAAGISLDSGNDAQLLKAIRTLRGGPLNIGQWLWSTATSGGPASGYLALNHATPSSATSLRIAESSAESLDYSANLGLLKAGDTVCLQSRDGAAFSHRFKVAGDPVDNGTYRTMAVTYVGGSGAVPADGAALYVALVPSNPADPSTDGIAGAFSNLKASATGTNATVTVTADAVCVKSSTFQQRVLNGLALAINSAANGANGLDTGTLAASTWYSVWVIFNPATLAVAGLLSTSATTPTMPSGYTFKARVGWARTDATNKYPLAFIQAGNQVAYKPSAGSNVPTYPAIASGAFGTTTALVSASVSGVVPPTAVEIKLQLFGASSNNTMAAPSAAFTGGTSGSNSPPLNNTGSTSTNSNMQGTFMLEGTSIYYYSQGAAGLLQCAGWGDNL